MKNCLLFSILIITLSLSGMVSLTHAEEQAPPYEEEGYDEDYQEVESKKKLTRFPKGTLVPMLGLSFLGIEGNVLTGVTGGVGYYVIDRLELIGTISAYFGKEYVLTVDPAIQWVFWEAKYFAPYVKVRGGPLFTLSGNTGTGGTILGGGGFYIFLGNTFGIKLGGLAGYLFAGNYENSIAWEVDVGLMF